MVGHPVAAAAWCQICGGPCTTFLAVHDHHPRYPFMPPGTGVHHVAENAEQPEPEPKPPRGKRARKPQEDRARKPEEDR